MNDTVINWREFISNKLEKYDITLDDFMNNEIVQFTILKQLGFEKTQHYWDLPTPQEICDQRGKEFSHSQIDELDYKMAELALHVHSFIRQKYFLEDDAHEVDVRKRNAIAWFKKNTSGTTFYTCINLLNCISIDEW